ncbi:cilia- and flagella-associated protein 251 [Spodoptera frugiperda]|uniref:Cilia- and flagella-associated protein 251 n=1 Tax=Spodoptera frugiperda TaxID=7108 RepID=A0A9R0CXZ0_SPOFR|nr:cilia- and flagella-associated protein 251 [Spodoptera frugiperda]XP_035433107.2 cilia- and flagella-associated protein 251 [Spodoptera frugiperda]
MPPDMAISMRHTKLKAEEAALLAGELNKPSWESKNEGIHERVSFEDTIWGFDLAGGIFYKTPLRVTFVKPESRAEKAGIRPGDKLLRINDLDTSTLTIQQAHDIIVESGIHLKLSVTSPDDEEDAYYCYEDPIVDGYDSEEERRLEEERAKKRRVCARVSHYWSLQWPWVSKRRLIYRESNCFMVPSKYEEARRDKYPPQPVLRYTDDIVLYHPDGENQDNTKRIPSLWEVKQKARKERQERLKKGYAASEASDISEEVPVSKNDHEEEEEELEEPPPQTQKSRRSTLKVERQETIDESKENEEEESSRIEEEEMDGAVADDENEEMNVNKKEEVNDEMNEEMIEAEDSATKEVEPSELNAVSEIDEDNKQVPEESAQVESNVDSDNVEMVNGEVNDDEILNEVLGKAGDVAARSDEDNILDSILSDEGQNLENSESNNER